MNRLKPYLPLIAFAVLVFGFAIGLTQGNLRDLKSTLIDQPFPDFALTTLDDPDSNITEAELEGSISLINIFGSWCVACVQEHPNLVQIAKTGRVRLVGVNWRDSRVKGRAWLDRYGDPYDLILFDDSSQLAIDLGVTGAPETFLVDQKGRIRYKHVGIITHNVWMKTLVPLIKTLESET